MNNKVHSQVDLLTTGKRPEFVCKELREHFSECFRRRPSALLLDDLDALCKAPEGQESNPSEDHYMAT